MAPSEKRLLREAFTRKLRRLCERLDEPHPRTVVFKHWFQRDLQTSDVSVTSLWVVGSYARGAPDCGDLDVVLTIKWTAHEPATTAVTRAFFGTLPYVRYYFGEPFHRTLAKDRDSRRHRGTALDGPGAEATSTSAD
jgi:hypothetical protein